MRHIREARKKRASRVFKKLKRIEKKLSKKKELLKMETFKEWMATEDPKDYDGYADSRGDNRVLVTTKEGTDGQKKLEGFVTRIYEELGISAWIEETRDEEGAPIFGLFTGLRDHNEEEVKEIQKNIKKIIS